MQCTCVFIACVRTKIYVPGDNSSLVFIVRLKAGDSSCMAPILLFDICRLLRLWRCIFFHCILSAFQKCHYGPSHLASPPVYLTVFFLMIVGNCNVLYQSGLQWHNILYNILGKYIRSLELWMEGNKDRETYIECWFRKPKFSLRKENSLKIRC
jgi:hypothetical protein